MTAVLVAGAGIGGLTASLALAKRGIAVTVCEQAERLEEAGAGIQLSPNATRILIALGLADRLAPAIVAPEAVRVRSARTGHVIATLPLGPAIAAQYGAPYWVLHRADLQRALLDAVADEPRITLMLGARVCDFAAENNGVAATLAGGVERRAGALICADGLWSDLRARLGDPSPPQRVGRAAWRATIAASDVPQPRDPPAVDLWLGSGGHIVHYPIRAGAAVNIVAVAADPLQGTAWSADATREEVLAHFPAPAWTSPARDLLAAPKRWQKWAIYDRAPSRQWGKGVVTLLGDAAHPMLPFLAQGAAMAIEDAAVLAAFVGHWPTDIAGALRAYETVRQPRTARVQRAARRNNLGYHLSAPPAFVRNAALRALGGEHALAQYDWIYRWRPEASQHAEG